MMIEEIKAKAKEKIEGKYLMPIFALLTFMAIIGLFVVVAQMIYNQYMALPFIIIICGLFLMGLLEIFIKLAHGKKANYMDLFNRTDLFWKCTAITIVVAVVTFICALLLILAFKSLAVFVFYQTEMTQLLSAFMILVGVLLCAAIATFYIALAISFSQVYFVLYDNEHLPVMEIFSRSMDLIEDYKIEYVLYTISFLGWAILGILTFGILLFWLVPYKMVADVLFYEKLVKQEKKMLEPKKVNAKPAKQSKPVKNSAPKPVKKNPQAPAKKQVQPQAKKTTNKTKKAS
ncbi:MAG: DUF975 family protein [Bacilli bacterium]|nr:DUF975 family protein [Bacilli bacterium]MBR3209807.1 DUF975 family protein [Bacilli bacterium]